MSAFPKRTDPIIVAGSKVKQKSLELKAVTVREQKELDVVFSKPKLIDAQKRPDRM